MTNKYFILYSNYKGEGMFDGARNNQQTPRISANWEPLTPFWNSFFIHMETLSLPMKSFYALVTTDSECPLLLIKIMKYEI